MQLHPAPFRSWRLVVELAIRVVPKQCLAYSWQGALLEQPKAGLEGVVYVNLAAGADDDDAASTAKGLVSRFLPDI
jgi:hypothetical protein